MGSPGAVAIMAEERAGGRWLQWAGPALFTAVLIALVVLFWWLL